MPELLEPKLPNGRDPEEQDRLRALNRSPHPYHHQSIPHAAHRLALPDAAQTAQDYDDVDKPSQTSYPLFSKESTPGSDSGTEADDEHFLKGLPAPRTKPHKGLRGRNELISGTSTPLPSPAIRSADFGQLTDSKDAVPQLPRKPSPRELARRRKVVVRRAAEVCILATLGVIARNNKQTAPIAKAWAKEYQLVGVLYCGLLALYPLRVVAWAYRKRPSPASIPLRIPSNFDPAPLLYPSAISLLVSLLVAPGNQSVLIPNLILSICCLPQQLIPKSDAFSTYDSLHWALSCLPLTGQSSLDSLRAGHDWSTNPGESIVLLYPLHQFLSAVLHSLTTTSLLTAELQLLSIGLINVLLSSLSPQAQILKSLLWVGGIGVLIFCGAPIRWEIALARVPKWRFKRVIPYHQESIWKRLRDLLTLRKAKYELANGHNNETSVADDSAGPSDGEGMPSSMPRRPVRVQTMGGIADAPTEFESPPSSPFGSHGLQRLDRSQTLPSLDSAPRRNATHTPSGRKKRASSLTVRPYLRLTQGQAQARKWLYAGYVYAAILVIISIGVRTYISRFALNGAEPIGWGLGYAFGGLNRFRFEVVNANLENWIRLPPRTDPHDGKQCHMGWVQHIRHDDFGEANTRLILTGYWLVILTVGLLVVFRLKDTYEVDTRRKVFHFMMVGMFLPAIFVDPTYAALCLSLALAIFLIFDLIRTSQLPPLSKPIASFLAPYVDGRDFRGPVVISHIFLLIGCAIPLWLSLASLPRSGSGYLAGWEVPTREVSMIAGVVCVGLGDAAASLIGRRYGHRKWLWGGGKSLEGSVAFAVAVFVGLVAASAWLRIGGWPAANEGSMAKSMQNAGVCCSMASLTEAVLTGGNDNVIVPIVLWACVKGLGV